MFGHNPAAPGFSQSHDPFADLSGQHADVDALDFEDTYDGLGDQLDETDDAFNDDTFGDSGPAPAPVGKDFDFFGQTNKVADAMEEEHMRFTRQQPIRKSQAPAPVHNQPYSYNAPAYSYQPAPKPTRSGYEKYREPEPVSELQVDASIWGNVRKKSATPAAAATVPQSQPSPALGSSAPSRKMMSLEEVEAALRSRPKAAASVQHQQPGFGTPEQQMAHLHAQSVQHPHYEPLDPRQQQAYPPSGGTPHAHPVSILQRPSSNHTPPVAHAVPALMAQQQQQSPMMAQAQLLQNQQRLQGDAARIPGSGQSEHRSQGSFSRQLQMAGHPAAQLQLTEEDKVMFLEAEARRAKRNHKIYVLSKDNGLMTPQDKSFITRIQLQQLVSATGDPNNHGSDPSLDEDFYYQVLSSLRAGLRPSPNQPLNAFAQTYLFQTGSRHGGMRRHGRGPENHMQRMEQQVQRAVEAAKNKPKNKQLVIEGSLGKISFSNAKTPKPLLNIKRTESNDSGRPASAQRTQSGTRSSTDSKAVLRSIESVYLTLMKMEDLARNLPPPPGPNAEPDQQTIELHAQLQMLNDSLWKDLKVHEPVGATAIHPFISFISYAKGMRVISRVFRHLSHEQRTTVLTLIVLHLDQLEVVRNALVQTGEPVNIPAATRENIELFSQTIFPSILQLLGESELQIVTGVLGLITGNLNVDVVARSKIGVEMLVMILSRAELIKEAGQCNEQSWQQWASQFNHFFNILEPSIPYIFPGTVASAEDQHVWHFLAAIGIGAGPDEQQRLVLAVKDRVMDTVALSKTLPADMARARLDNVNLFLHSIGLDVELLK